MVDTQCFKEWLEQNTSYKSTVIGDYLSRIKRADRIIEWYDDDYYSYQLEKNADFNRLSVSVKSQLRKAVELYRSCQADMTMRRNG